MKKLLLSLLAFAASTMGLCAQNSSLQLAPQHFSFKDAGRLFKHTMKNTPAKEKDADNLEWWGYVQDNTYRTALGAQSTGAYNQAILIKKDNPVVKGNTIKAVRFYLRNLRALSDVKVWISTTLPSSANNANVLVMSIPDSELTGGDESEDYCGMLNEVELTTPYTMGNSDIYVGYSYNVTSTSSSAGQFPIVLSYEEGVPGSLYLSTASISWQAAEQYGPLDLRVLVEGAFLQNAATPGSLGEVITPLDNEAIVQVPLTNVGQQGISSIDYTVTSADGVVSDEQHLDLNSTYSFFGGTTAVGIHVPADNEVGSQTKTLTVTKVNGVENESDTKSVDFTLTTILKTVPHGIAVEEYTGTTCGWCPRGLVGMEKMRKTFGDAFVGIGIHRYTKSLSQDAMYISTYTQVNYSGAPSSRINRGPEVDPYEGNSGDVCDDIRAALAIPAKVGITLTGRWNEDSTQVVASADVEALIDGQYAIEYVLIADSLTGKTDAWKQYNYYSSSFASQTGLTLAMIPKDMQFLWTTGATYYPIFNDVAISLAKQNQTTAIGQLTTGQVVNNTYTLAMPSENNRSQLINAITKERVYVVALLIDQKTGRIANAAKSIILPYEAPAPEPSIANGTYYLQNVATGKYLAAGHDWGTRSIVNEDGLDFILTEVEGKYTIDSQVTNGGDSHYLNAGLYVDGASFGWTVEEVAEGVFTMSDGTKFLAVGDNDETILAEEASETAQWVLKTYEERVEALAGATLSQPANATFAIRDANFNRNDLRSSAWAVKEGTPNLSGGNNSNNNAESYMAAFEIEQTIAGLPNGAYQLDAQAAVTFHDNRKVKEYDGNAGPVIFANNQTSDFQLMETADQLTSMSQMSEQFTAGKYAVNPIIFYVEDGNITVGAKCSRADIWAVWDNFRLTYLGEEMPEQILDLTINFERMATKGYNADQAEVDLTAAKNFLGVDELTTSMLRIENPDGELISDYAPYDGWFNEEGVAEQWGDNAKVCVKFFQAIPDGKFDICDMNEADEVGKTYTVKWRLTNEKKSVRFTVNVTFIEYVTTLYQPEIIATIDVPVALKPAMAYEGATATFPVEQITEALGIASIADASQYIVNVTDGNFVANTTDGWRNANGDAAAWNTGSGQVCVKINKPASGSIDYLGAIDDTYKEGDTYTAKWGFVNSNEKAAVVNVNITFTSIPSGIADINAPLSQSGIIYNLNGQRVEKPKKGIHIINGKKTMTKL